MSHLLDYHEGASDVIEEKLKAPAENELRKVYKEQGDLYRTANSYAMIMCAVSGEVFHKRMNKDTAVEA